MRVILINVSRAKEALYASVEQKGWMGRIGREKSLNRRHKKPRSFDQGLCYRLEDSLRLFFVAPRRSVGLVADMAQRTGLEPATPGVTGRYSNRLNYRCVSLWTCVLTRLIKSSEIFQSLF